MIITVTQAMIDEPCRGPRSENCPVARAVNAVLDVKYSSLVSAFSIGIVYGPRRNFHQKALHVVNMPLIASQFIHDYDTQRPTSPFTFDLDIPKEYLCS